MSTDNSTPPPSAGHCFALEAYERVHPGKTEVYERMAAEIDQRVLETEPGMLVHALTRHVEHEDEVIFRWLEVFENPEALQAHVDSPHVQAHLQKMSEGVLCGTSDIVIYADWDDEQKAYWSDAFSGSNLRFATMPASFFLGR